MKVRTISAKRSGERRKGLVLARRDRNEYHVFSRTELDKIYDKLRELVVERSNRCEQRVEHLEDHIVELRDKLEEVKKTLAKLEEQVEAIREDLAIEARHRVGEVIEAETGEKVKPVGLEITGVGKFDIYGRTSNSTVIGNAYTSLTPSRIAELVDKVRTAYKFSSQLFAGSIIVAVFYLREVALGDKDLQGLIGGGEVPLQAILLVTPVSYRVVGTLRSKQG